MNYKKFSIYFFLILLHIFNTTSSYASMDLPCSEISTDKFYQQIVKLGNLTILSDNLLKTPAGHAIDLSKFENFCKQSSKNSTVYNAFNSAGAWSRISFVSSGASEAGLLSDDQSKKALPDLYLEKIDENTIFTMIELQK